MSLYESIKLIVPQWPDHIQQVPIFMFECFTFSLNMVTLPVSILIEKPYQKWKRSNAIRARCQKSPDASYTYWAIQDEIKLPSCMDQWALNQHFWNNLQHMSDFIPKLVDQYANYPFIGVRQPLPDIVHDDTFNVAVDNQKQSQKQTQAQAQDQKQTNKNKTLIRLRNEYTWATYGQVNREIQRLAHAMRSDLGIKPGDKVAIMLETCPQWYICLHALYALNAIPVTLYANLGQEALIHALKQSKPSLIITEQTSLLPVLRQTNTSIPEYVKHILCIKSLYDLDPTSDIIVEPDDQFQTLNHWFVDLFDQLEDNDLEYGHSFKHMYDLSNYERTDVALLMYTSGSTGLSKAVIITHGQLINSLQMLSSRLLGAYPYDDMSMETYLAYLPLAHIYEFLCELTFASFGFRLAYARANTLFANAHTMHPETKGDMCVARPTIMTAVPLVLERVRSTLRTQIIAQQGMWRWRLMQSLARQRQGWHALGFECYLTRKLFEPIKRQFGGRVRLWVSGGAPLSPSTQQFVQSFLDVNVLQGYASTECTGACLIQDISDRSTSCAGSPVLGARVRLADWPEGGYRVTDKPRPRGEIIVGSKGISSGYLDNEQENENAFFEQDGLRWWKSGDIAEVDSRGVFRIVDRKKDIIKLQFGEYIPLGRVEAVLKSHVLVDNVCVYGDMYKNHLVALIQPNETQLRSVANQQLTMDTQHMSLQDLCSNIKLAERVQKVLAEYARLPTSGPLTGRQVPSAVHLCHENWVQINLITAAMKVRRKIVYQYYQKQIDQLYKKLE